MIYLANLHLFSIIYFYYLIIIYFQVCVVYQLPAEGSIGIISYFKVTRRFILAIGE
jgi:hypothetical protein